MSYTKYPNFRLGNKRIPEKRVYDHVGVKAYIPDDDSTVVDE